ncbi:MAG: PIN domain nuclease [Acidimicrobiia bacterium]|nr:PIN domain nuclease [Acidimicrobiia bacterium]
MFVEIVRLFIVVLGTAGGFLAGRDLGSPDAVGAVGGMLGCLLGYVTGGILGRLLERAVGVVERRADRLPPAQVLAGMVGGVVGGATGALFAAPLVVLLSARLAIPLVGLVAWVVGYLGFRVAARKSEQLFHLVGLSTRPLVRVTPYDRTEGFLVDTSAIMDGRLLPLARSGLLDGDLLVPRFVVDELQGLADAPDGTRARRARRGLEVLDVIRREGPPRLYLLDDEVPEVDAVDAKLVALARRLQIRLLTDDANLSRVAEVQGVPTCNLRRLVADLGPEVVPGEVVRLALTRPGREEGQGVGFLEDGSMVVVNRGAGLVGRGEQAFVVASVVPTSAGRLLFARPTGAVDRDEEAATRDRRTTAGSA